MIQIYKTVTEKHNAKITTVLLGTNCSDTCKILTRRPGTELRKTWFIVKLPNEWNHLQDEGCPSHHWTFSKKEWIKTGPFISTALSRWYDMIWADQERRVLAGQSFWTKFKFSFWLLCSVLIFIMHKYFVYLCVRYGLKFASAYPETLFWKPFQLLLLQPTQLYLTVLICSWQEAFSY